ncbi:MAG: hypothetical protein R3B68_10230 [Phycisphaerales bacterium]
MWRRTAIAGALAGLGALILVQFAVALATRFRVASYDRNHALAIHYEYPGVDFYFTNNPLMDEQADDPGVDVCSIVAVGWPLRFVTLVTYHQHPAGYVEGTRLHSPNISTDVLWQQPDRVEVRWLSLAINLAIYGAFGILGAIGLRRLFQWCCSKRRGLPNGTVTGTR